jgi:preprotein translocase subunit SecB
LKLIIVKYLNGGILMPVQFNIEEIVLLSVKYGITEEGQEPIEDDTKETFKGSLDKGLPIKINLNCASNYNEETKRLRVILGIIAQDKTHSFLLEAEMGGAFLFKSKPAETKLTQIRDINGPGIIYPYLRECVTDLMRRAGREQFYLPPVNFVEISKKAATKAKK